MALSPKLYSGFQLGKACPNISTEIIGAVKAVVPAAELIARLAREFDAVRSRLALDAVAQPA